MKKRYTFLLALGLFMLGTNASFAQNRASTSGKASIGYAKYDDAIWEYDGLSLDLDARVGCAIVITRDMLEPYIGGTITGMRVGWDTSTETGKYDGFVRNSFTGEDLSTGTATVRYSYSDTNPGWNNMTMSRYVIPEDVEQQILTTPTEELMALDYVKNVAMQNSGTAYIFAKRVNHLQATKAAATTWKARRARINTISPGVIVTPLAYDEFAAAGDAYQQMIDASAAMRTGSSDEIAEAGAFLLSDKAGFINGTDLLIDGGTIAAIRTGEYQLHVE